MFKKLLTTSDDASLAFMRIMLGIVFFAHGAQKVLGWFGGYGFSGTMGFFTTQMHIPPVFAFLAICAEFFGSLGLIFGFLTRIAAFGIAVNMIVAVLMVHIHVGFFVNWFGNQKGEGGRGFGRSGAFSELRLSDCDRAFTSERLKNMVETPLGANRWGAARF